MELTGELAEILGMFAADGCLQKDYVCMLGNIFENKDYYDKIVCPLYSKVFGINVTAYEKKSNSVYGFYVCNKKIVESFREFGFTNNKTYTVRIPKEIINSENSEVWKYFIRGFADFDGCFSLMKRKGKYKEFKIKFNTYPRIKINITSPLMIEDISVLLKKLNLEHTFGIEKKKNTTDSNAYWIMVRGEKNVENWIKTIGFNNPSKIVKYKVWKKFGHCPPDSNIEERKLFLEGKLRPEDSYKQ
jgi:hypothetical protein